MKRINPPSRGANSLDETSFLLSDDSSCQIAHESEMVTNDSDLDFQVNESPPWPTTLLLAIQHILLNTSALVAYAFIVSDLICARFCPILRAKLIGLQLFITGFGSILQSTIGLRILENSTGMNLTDLCPSNEIWTSKMTLIQGGIIGASLIQIGLSATGLIGFMTKFIGPITVAPLMICLEISLMELILLYMEKHWMSIVVMLTVLIFAFFMNKIAVPIPGFSFKQKRFKFHRVLIFHLFPYLLALAVTWLICLILTETGVFTNPRDYSARTDVNEIFIKEAPWFTWPYPLQFGLPVFNVTFFVGMLAGSLCCMIDTIGDFHATAKVCCQAPPPAHVINRAMLIQGVSNLTAGLIGSGTGQTDFSQTVGITSMTKVASRRTTQLAGFIFLIFGMFAKTGGLLASIPDPLIGGLLASAICVLGGVGMAQVQNVDMRSGRNTWILGFSILIGVMVPKWVNKVPVKTSVTELNQVFQILLSSGMVIAGIVGCLLDNIVPGVTREQRGMAPSISEYTNLDENEYDGYRFSNVFCNWLETRTISKFIPIMPTFRRF